MAYKKSPVSFVKHKSNAIGYMAVGSSAYMHGDPDTPHPDPEEKDNKKLTKQQKLIMAGKALDQDVSFEAKTMDDARSSRRVVEIKKQLKTEKPELYRKIYGE